MYYELYVDVFFMVNFTMDAILLILLKKLLACPAGYGRVFAGAATGAAMTCIENYYCNCHIQENTGIKICSISWSH